MQKKYTNKTISKCQIKKTLLKSTTNEIIRYLIIGLLTTVVSIATYYIFTRILYVNYYFSNILSWICAVIFAFFFNRKFVFMDSSNFFSALVKFFITRIFSLVEEMVLLWLMLEILLVNDFISKCTIQFVIIVTNYVTGKFFAFKSKKEDNKCL